MKEKNCTIQAAKECRAAESSVQSRMWNAVQCKTVPVNCEVKFCALHYTAVSVGVQFDSAAKEEPHESICVEGRGGGGKPEPLEGT